MNDTTPSQWSFYNPVDIRFGRGVLKSAASLFSRKRMLLVTTPGMLSRGTAERIMAQWPDTEWSLCAEVSPNPDMEQLDRWGAEWREQGIEAIIGLGGGSAVDSAKVLAVLLGAKEGVSLTQHFREGAPLPPASPLPVVAIPTTSGTGSEVTPFATIWDGERRKKESLAGKEMFPRLAILDPELTESLPWNTTLATGMDALCQAMESVWNRNASPVSLAWALQGAQRAWEVLRNGQAILHSCAMRAQLMEASLLAGLAISQTRTALCHSMSYPITARFGVPHGIACGFLIPAVLRFNQEKDDGRLTLLAERLGFSSLEQLADELEQWLIDLEVPALLKREYGMSLEALLPSVGEMITPGRADNNLRPANQTDLSILLKEYLPGFLAAGKA